MIPDPEPDVCVACGIADGQRLTPTTEEAAIVDWCGDEAFCTACHDERVDAGECEEDVE